MVRFLLRRAPSVVVVLFAASLLAFFLPRLAPGDPATAVAGPDATREQIAAVHAELGLDRPMPAQYASWLRDVVLHGDFGTSYVTHREVTGLLGDRLGSTVQLALLATLLMIVIGVALGVAAGSSRRPWARSLLDLACTVLLAIPPFLTGLLLALLLGVAWRVLPVSGEVSLLEDPEIGIQYLALPALALALPSAAAMARLIQTAMRDARAQEYVQTAVAKGASPRRITVRHVLRNSLGSALVSLGIRLGDLLGGAVVIEFVFARNGLGSLAVTSSTQRDYLVIQALVLLAVAVAVLMQVLTEVGLSLLDPRIRLEGAR
ncbi:ABC transporter permease [Streptomyces sp. 6N223]|uniref:ABC transporter permease n=1 Tax=Streptomyces sp. 6N223 TaxID=3457412 RepID=UPI003FD1151C